MYTQKPSARPLRHLSQINLVYSSLYFFQVHFNFILPSKPSSPSLSLPFRLSERKSSHLPPVLDITPIRNLIPLIISGGELKLWSSPLWNFLRSYITLLFCPILILSLSPRFQTISTPVLIRSWDTKFHAHIKWIRLYFNLLAPELFF